VPEHPHVPARCIVDGDVGAIVVVGRCWSQLPAEMEERLKPKIEGS